MDLEVSTTELIGLFKRNRTAAVVSLSLVIPFMLILITVLQPWQATFSIRAETGVLEIITTENQPSWMLSNIDASVDSGEIEQKVGILTILSNIKVKFQSLSEGGIYVTLQSMELQQPNSPIATFEDSESGLVSVVKNFLELKFPVSLNTQGYTLPFQGMIKIGDVLHSQTSLDNPILTSGNIEVFGDALFGEGRFSALEEELEPGDQMLLYNENNKPVVGYGFVAIKDHSIMQLQFHAEADYTEVSRFGSNGYLIGPTVWDRFSKDPILKILIDFLNVWVPLVLAIILISARLLDAHKKNLIKEEGSEGSV